MKPTPAELKNIIACAIVCGIIGLNILGVLIILAQPLR